MNKKIRQAEVLSKWFAVDRILFGNINPKTVMSENEFENYVTAKGAFLSGLHEIYSKKLKYNPSFQKNYRMPKNLSEMKAYGYAQAEFAKERARKLLTTSSVSLSIRNEIKNRELSEGAMTEEMKSYIIDKKLKSTALDIVMLEVALAESGRKNLLKDFSGKVMIDAYKTFRDALIKYAY